QRYCIAYYQFFELRIFNILVSLAAKYGMGTKSPNRQSSPFSEYGCRFAQGAGGIADIINQYYVSSGYITNYRHACYLVGSFALFIANNHVHLKILSHLPHTVGTAYIGGCKDKVFKL